MARVGAVVLSFNRRDLTTACVASLLGLGLKDLDVVVVDNASTDGSADAVRAAFPDVDVLASPENVGFGRGMNLGAERALAKGCEHVLLLNNDTEFPDATFLERLLRALDDDPRAAIAAPSVRSIETGRALFDAPFADPFGEFPATGAVLLVRGAFVRERGLYDPVYFLYFEDRDLFQRARYAGWNVVHVRDAVVEHSERSPSSGHLSATKLYHMNRSAVVYARRWLTFRQALRAFWHERAKQAPWQLRRLVGRRAWPEIRAYFAGYVAGLRTPIGARRGRS